MKSDFFALLYRLRKIERWNGSKVIDKDDEAQHSYYVAIIVHLLCESIRIVENKNVNEGQAVICALYHDYSDSILTHIISPIKNNNENIKGAITEIEKKCEKYILSLLPVEFVERQEQIFNNMYDDIISEMIEVADIIDAYCKCKIEIKNGNLEFTNPYIQMEKALNRLSSEKKYVSYFIKTFLDSFDDMYAEYRYLNI